MNPTDPDKREPWVLFRIGACILASLSILAAEEGQGAGNEKIPELVRQLADDDFATREKACKALRDMGAPAAEHLRAFRDDPEPEIRKRVEGLLGDIAMLGQELAWIDPRNASRKDHWSWHGGQRVKLIFRNLSAKPVLIFWVETDGSLKPWRGSLEAGDSAVCEASYIGHFWLVTDEAKKPLGLYKVDRDKPVLAVRDRDIR